VILAVVILHLIFATWLSLYGFQALALSLAYCFYRKPRPSLKQLEEFPDVTVQLPVYNERYVVERVIDAAAALDWPCGKLHIQVLDDSTDETTGLARARAEQHRARGIDITVIHRTNRTNYKAGHYKMAWQALAAPTLPFLTPIFALLRFPQANPTGLGGAAPT